MDVVLFFGNCIFLQTILVLILNLSFFDLITYNFTFYVQGYHYYTLNVLFNHIVLLAWKHIPIYIQGLHGPSETNDNKKSLIKKTILQYNIYNIILKVEGKNSGISFLFCMKNMKTLKLSLF